MKWYKFSQTQLAQIPLKSDEVNKVLQGFINHTGGDPIFFTDQNNVNHLLIHGSSPNSDNNIYFFIGNGKNFEDQPVGYVAQNKIKDWIISQGYSPDTNIIACYAGYAQSDANTEFNTYNPINISARENGDSLTISQ